MLAAQQAALAHPGIDRHRLPGQQGGKLPGQGKGGVVVLTEDDAAVLQPGPALRAMLGQEVQHRIELGIASLGAGQLADDHLQVIRLLRGQVADRLHDLPGLLLVLQRLPAQQPLGGRAAREEAGADALQQQGLHEAAGTGALLQRRREGQGGRVGEIEGVVGAQAQAGETDIAPDPRVGRRRGVGIRMDDHADTLQQPRLFQGLAPPQHGMTDHRVVGLQESRLQGLA